MTSCILGWDGVRRVGWRTVAVDWVPDASSDKSPTSAPATAMTKPADVWSWALARNPVIRLRSARRRTADPSVAPSREAVSLDRAATALSRASKSNAKRSKAFPVAYDTDAAATNTDKTWRANASPVSVRRFPTWTTASCLRTHVAPQPPIAGTEDSTVGSISEMTRAMSSRRDSTKACPSSGRRPSTWSGRRRLGTATSAASAGVAHVDVASKLLLFLACAKTFQNTTYVCATSSTSRHMGSGA